MHAASTEHVKLTSALLLENMPRGCHDTDGKTIIAQKYQEGNGALKPPAMSGKGR